MHSPTHSLFVIPRRTCEESHPRQSLPMCAGMRSLDLARDDDTSGMRSLDLARDDDTSGMRSLDLARDDDTFGFAGMTHSNNQSGSRSVVVIPSRTCEESHPRQSLPMCAGMRSLDLARDDNTSGMRSLDLARDDNTSGMRSLDLARDDNTFGFVGMTHSNNQSGSRSVVVIPSRACEESHPRQSLPMCAGMRSLGVARMPV
jgi:hypothetical protein